MRCTIVSAADREPWCAMMRRAHAGDVYFLPEYHRLYEFMGVESLAFAASDGDDHLFHPFLLRPVGRIGMLDAPEGWHDIETVYGYSGPVATTTDPAFLAAAWRGFDQWCAEHDVVCEFLRFNPILASERFAAPETEVSLNRETVEIHLESGEDGLWQGYDSTQRNRVRKAIKRGLTCEETSLEEGLPAFCDLYEGTMRRAGATGFYFFPQRYYDDLQRTMADHTRLFVVRSEGKPIAAGIFFIYGRVLHYHLGASHEDALALAPNNLMFHQVALWGQRHGFERLHLGGGRSSAPDDALLRFKKRLSPHLLPFCVGQRIHDPKRYQVLCDLWQGQAAEPPPAGYFRPYRLDLPATEQVTLASKAQIG